MTAAFFIISFAGRKSPELTHFQTIERRGKGLFMNFKTIILLTLVLVAAGCGSKSKKEVASRLDRSALTVEQWRKIAPEEKFDAAILRRLRSSDAELEDDDAWREFMDKVVAPEMRRATGPPSGKTMQESNALEFFKEG